MTSTSDINITFRSEESNCGDGSCWSFTTFADVTMGDNEEFTVDVTIDRDDVYAAILERLGYGHNVEYIDDDNEEEDED